MDAWKQEYELMEKFTREWEPRPDLRVTALACERTVRFELGILHNEKYRLSRYNWYDTQRNVSTMRELAVALLAACDFVDASNPEWASHHE